MGRRKRGERILGPYEHGRQWRVVEVAEDGTRKSISFATEAKAEKYIELIRAALTTVSITVHEALEEYIKYAKLKGNKPSSIESAQWAVKRFFPDDDTLVVSVTLEALRDRYHMLTTELAVDSHRNALAQIKTFFAWCVRQRYVKENPAEHLEGVGRRSTGKEQLRLKEARVWYAKALELADGGDVGALGALMALLLGLRASEITGLKVGDLDEDERPGDLLHIRKGKTAAAKRTLHVPGVIRAMLVRTANDRPSDRYLLGQHWRDWPLHQVHRVCRLAKVPLVTAHSMRGLLATLATQRGNVVDVAAMLGHENTRITLQAYAAPGSQGVSDRKLGLERLSKALPTEGAKITHDPNSTEISSTPNPEET